MAKYCYNCGKSCNNLNFFKIKRDKQVFLCDDCLKLYKKKYENNSDCKSENNDFYVKSTLNGKSCIVKVELADKVQSKIDKKGEKIHIYTAKYSFNGKTSLSRITVPDKGLKKIKKMFPDRWRSILFAPTPTSLISPSEIAEAIKKSNKNKKKVEYNKEDIKEIISKCKKETLKKG